ncbi:MAG: TonB-dependent receptor [Bacteroidetes bacterium]|nr:TonB-dependent receptor [Bacteroidota bacterium]
MKKNRNILVILFFCTINSFAQKILKDTTVTVVKAFQPTIADAFKINEMPVVKDSVPPIPNLSYSIHSKKVFTPFTVEPLKPAKMVGEPLVKLYNGLVKLGAGNYNTPYAEIFYNNGRSKEYSYGTHLKHFSSSANMEGYGFGGTSDNRIELYGKKFLRKQTLSGGLDYSRNVIHYYGYDTSALFITDNNYIKQRYSNIGGNAALQSHYSDSIHTNYFLKLKYYNLSDFYSTSENNIYASGDFSGYYEKQLIHLPVTVDYYNNKSKTDTANSALISLSPYLTSAGEKWSARIGVGIFMEGNEHDKSRFAFAPKIDFNYNAVDNILIPYAGVTGGLKKNSLQTLTDENPFLIPAPNIKNTNTKWEIYGGMRGSISKTVSYNARTSYSKIEDLYFFVNDYSDAFKKGFNTVYYDVSLLNVHGELQYQHTEKIKFMAKGDYNKYTLPSDSMSPWHRPPMQLTFTANYNLKNKIAATADVFVIGKRFANSYGQVPSANPPSVVWTGITELKPIVDVNLGLEYRYSKKLSAFVHLNNLGFSRYYIWNNYPSYKFNFMAGISMAF